MIILNRPIIGRDLNEPVGPFFDSNYQCGRWVVRIPAIDQEFDAECLHSQIESKSMTWAK